MIDALIGHLAGDYLFQNDWMALNKKQHSFHCAVHCFIWSLCVTAFAGWWSPWTFAVLFTTHFIQDRSGLISAWMNLIGQRQFRDAMKPWSIIIVDNIWHIVTLWFIALTYRG